MENLKETLNKEVRNLKYWRKVKSGEIHNELGITPEGIEDIISFTENKVSELMDKIWITKPFLSIK